MYGLQTRYIFQPSWLFLQPVMLVFREFTQNKDITRFSPQKVPELGEITSISAIFQIGEVCKICPERWNNKATGYYGLLIWCCFKKMSSVILKITENDPI